MLPENDCKNLFLRVILLFVLAASPAFAATAAHPVANPMNDVVAVGRAPGRIVLATPALTGEAHRWRFRVLRVEPDSESVRQVSLSRGASKLLIVFADNSTAVVDLTQPVSVIRKGEAASAQHRLPGTAFAVAQQDRLCPYDDSGRQAGECGPVPAALADTAPRQVAFSREQNPTGDPAPDKLKDGSRGANVPVASDQIPDVAALRTVVGASPSDATVAGFAQALAAQSPGPYLWSYFKVQPEPALYAPVVELAPGELDVPTDFNIWERLVPMTKGTTYQDYHAAYNSLGAERFRRCSYYYRTASYPGSWLIEYWYYYAFDEGPNPHLHDAEHIFIEVDKLGGTVRSVLASAHNSLVPNNLYTTFSPRTKPITLPLFAFAELGKHAMAPDINRDGRFDRRVDVNGARDHYEVWGVRDTGAKWAMMMEPYYKFRTLPRQREDRVALAATAQFFPNLDVPAEKQTCELLPFPEASPPCTSCAPASPEAANAYVTGQRDARRPTDIYKPWVLPTQQLQLGIGIFDHLSNHRELYAAWVMNLRQLTGERFPFAGRLALDAMYSPSSRSESIPGTNLETRFAHAVGTGARFERFINNTQGIYGGFTAMWRRDSTVTTQGVVIDPSHWVYDGIWYRLGLIVELPSLRKGNMTHRFGVAMRPGEIRAEWRVTLSTLRRHGRRHFGIGEKDPNPYGAAAQ